jgi:outer membrane protein assembly factor BamB
VCAGVFVLALALLGWASRVSAQSLAWQFLAGSEVNTAPALGADGTVYLGARDGHLYALRSNGTMLWSFLTRGVVVSSPALGADGTVYFGSQDGRLYAVNLWGQERWEFATGGEVFSSPAVALDGTLYVGSLDGKLYAVAPNGTNAVKRWEFATGGGVFASPAVGADGTIYFGSRDGRLYALWPSGQMKWAFSTGAAIEASPAIGTGGTIYCGSLDNRFYAVNPDGTRRWSYQTNVPFYASPAVGVDGTVYAAAGNGTVFAFRPDGTELWEIGLTNQIRYSSIALAADGTIYVGGRDGRLYALTSSGTRKWSYQTGGPITYASPAIGSDGRVYIGSEDGKLYALAGGSPLASQAWPEFRRDARHTASGFVERSLPAAYSPGLPMTVNLVATPQPGIAFYTVEDSPPAGWTVSVTNISEGGYYDSGNRRIRFGPFLDSQPRTLSYQVTPPQGESGNKSFTGISAVDGIDRLVGGTHVLSLIPLHPADAKLVDGWLTIGEMAAYGAAWKRGTAWSTGPNPISSAYLACAIQLWQNGESYQHTTNYPTPPQWWVNSASGYPAGPAPVPLPDGTTAPNGIATASLPLTYRPGVAFSVVLEISPASNVVVQAIEDQPPAGWFVASISGGGFYDPMRAKVKWGPFFDASPRVLSYQVTPPTGATNAGIFAGAVAFDANSAVITGTRTIQPAAANLPDLFAIRLLPASYSAGAPLTVAIQTAALSNHVFYSVADAPPAGWAVGQVSDGGAFDAASQTVRFGPYYDGQARTLTYQLTPPRGETGLRQFLGMFSIDGVPGLVAGDHTLDAVPLHPADLLPTDAWLTIGEITGYAAAWKRGTNWPTAPVPVPTDYLTQAIALWQDGEAYYYDPHAGPVPFSWTSLPPLAAPAYPAPAPVAPGTLSPRGTAVAGLPATAAPGTTLTVTLEFNPSASTAVCALEDQPPTNWVVTAVAGGGALDTALGKIKWGPFFDALPRSFSYQVAVPQSAIGLFTFGGQVAFDGSVGALSGERSVFVGTGPSPGAFVTRALPATYLPGAKLGVVLQTASLTNVGYYAIEEMPPAGWQVGALNEGGYYDGVNRVVRFGPYFDGLPRTLTYEVTPPAAAVGAHQFTGNSLVDDLVGVVGGDYTIDMVPAHPADIKPTDSWLTIGEVTAYGATWKTGGKWPLAPNPIPSSYVARAITLWLDGEQYTYDPATTNAPFWWDTPTNPAPAGTVPVAVVRGSTATNGSATVTLPKFFTPGLPATVTCEVEPATSVLVYAVEDQPPAGWAIAAITAGGVLDARLGKVKWGPFFDNVPRTLTYQVIPQTTDSNLVQFVGGAAFNGLTTDLAGRRQMFRTGTPVAPQFTAVQFGPTGALLSLQGFAGEVYVIEASRDLWEWIPLATVTNLTDAVICADTNASALRQRFYRAFWP